MANSASQPRSVRCVRTVQSASQFTLKPAATPAPLAGLSFGHHLAVVLDAERIGAEDERVLAVVERVEEDLNRVGVVEIGVAAALADDEMLSGSESKQMTATYRFCRSRRNRISVRSVAGSPSFGSC